MNMQSSCSFCHPVMSSYTYINIYRLLWFVRISQHQEIRNDEVTNDSGYGVYHNGIFMTCTSCGWWSAPHDCIILPTISLNKPSVTHTFPWEELLLCHSFQFQYYSCKFKTPRFLFNIISPFYLSAKNLSTFFHVHPYWKAYRSFLVVLICL